MNQTLIYIGDDLLDLDPSTVVTVTIQSINVGDLKTRNVSYTNSIKIPSTENNRRILGYSNLEESRTSKPYQFNATKIVQNGIETLIGLCIITRFDGSHFNINIYEDLFDIFKFLEGKKIKDIDPIADTAWDTAYMDSSRNATSGVISAIMQWGHSVTDIFEADFFLPSFYYHSFITAILESTGLTLSGSILSDSRFTDLVIPFCGDSFAAPSGVVAPAPAFIAKGTEDANTGATVAPTYMGSIVANDMLFAFAISNQQGGTIGNIGTPSGWTKVDMRIYRNSGGTIVGNVGLYYKIATGSESGTLSISRTGSTGAGKFFEAQLYQFRGTANIALESYNVTDGGGSTTVTWNSVTVGGLKRTLLAFVGLNRATVAAGVPSGYTQEASDIANLTMDLNVKEDVSSDGAVTATGGTVDGWGSFHLSIYNNDSTVVDWNLYWPDIEVKEILRDFFTRFAIIAKQRKGVLYLKTIEEIITDRAGALDWSAKLTKSNKSIDFANRYGQENYFDYNNQVNDEVIGRGIMEISNETLDPIKTIFSSVFQSVPTSYFSSDYKSAKMDVFTPDSVDITDFINSPAFTLLTLRDPGTDPAITFDVTARTDYKVGYFIDSVEAKDSGFEYFINQFYPKYAYALQKSKLVVKEYLITEIDIYNYDPHKMIYDGEGYYLINKITNFIPGRISKVEMFKVG